MPKNASGARRNIAHLAGSKNAWNRVSGTFAKVRLPIPSLTPPFPGSAKVVTFEHPVQMTLVNEAAGKRDLIDVVLACYQESFCSLDAPLHHPAMGRHASG